MAETTTQLTGAGIGQGVALGRVLRMSDPLPEPAETPSTRTPDEEKARVAEAVAAVADDLRSRAAKVTGVAADVLEAQSMMAEDSTLADDVATRIDGGTTAERAVFEGFAVFRDMLIDLGGYMGERATDLDDVAQRVIAALAGRPAPGVPESDEPYVLVAHDLAPADTALLDLTKVLGLVTREGGPTSHTAILAREKAIVAIVGVAGADSLADGTEVIVDAASGTVTVAPADDQRADAQHRIEERAAALAGGLEPGALADGTPIPLLANLGSADGTQKALDAGAEGVGLFRTEFLFLDQRMAPTVEQQREHYIALLSAFPGKKVVVRVLDAGADKPLAFLNDAHEDNPALGLRGLRALRANEDLLREQLTALAEADAATEADLWVMAPMVSTVEETRYFVELATGYGLKTVGVMVEVPSAALLADRVLQTAAFASIGTNDLTQYTLAADRLLGSVAGFQDPWHPAVLRLIGEVGAAGAAHGKPVGICGEAAADPLLAVVLVGLGATTLSMSPAALADVRLSLTRYTLDQARALAEVALAADGAAEARDAVRAAATPPPQ
ncbi:phosphoenolpyruvate--protein phosphotransferase [Leifsonia aquatica]|jgi:phosphotransferase system enzyme I (PtsI)|uniref:Phosphoenolpyruvate-protein phosphotransferase n=3 Tax=Leifsonia aquatica TaxID=144185 RepID=A0A7W4UWD9_LEIAQ|nr:phosphoenolpyruvate--protein phosphotransferase [Leifsonia aquatica]MBB2967438.1 phosphotransferase system enzyme I (PtsI) [Leifsonia aquatica]